MRTRIKICCVRSEEEAQLAIECGADAIGMVGVKPENPRSIPDHQIAAIATGLPRTVASVLLTSEESASAIADQAIQTGVSTIQIISHIDPPESAALARLLPNIRRVQVIHVEDARCLDLIDSYAGHVHAFLLDSGRPSGAVPEFGGTGRVHDWEVSRSFVFRSPRPVFLAGGLTSENVGHAIDRVQPFGVDVCSGIRTEGRLDSAKLSAFFTAVQTADNSRH